MRDVQRGRRECATAGDAEALLQDLANWGYGARELTPPARFLAVYVVYVYTISSNAGFWGIV